jgi:peptide/nickel transport system substrate-binding protein
VLLVERGRLEDEGQPRRGGRLHVGLTGGTSADTWDPHFASNVTDFARSNAVYECVGSAADGTVVPVLAEEFSPNSDATEWTVRLRKGIEFHNGKEMTADDVIYSFRRALHGREAARTGASAAGPLDAKAARKVDKYTVRLLRSAPFATRRSRSDLDVTRNPTTGDPVSRISTRSCTPYTRTSPVR